MKWLRRWRVRRAVAKAREAQLRAAYCYTDQAIMDAKSSGQPLLLPNWVVETLIADAVPDDAELAAKMRKGFVGTDADD